MIGEAIRRGADAIDARDAFDPEVRASYLNASEALSCIRKQWYEKHADPSEKDEPEDWGYARRGKHGETYIINCLRAANVPMLFTGEDQESIRDDELRISCTPDGLVWDVEREGWLVTEFKTIDPRTNRSNLPRVQHTTQVQIAAAMFEKHRGEFPELGDAPILGCLLIYMDASNYNDIVEHRVQLKPKILDQLKGRANRVLDGKSAGRLPREGAVGTKAECKQRCKWNKLCGVDGAGTSTAQGVTGGADAELQVASYISAKEAAADHKARQDAAGERLKAILKKNNVTKLEVDGHVVSLGTRAGSVSYAKVVKDHCPGVDLEPYRGNPSETLTVK